jgi:hypothetical protein
MRCVGLGTVQMESGRYANRQLIVVREQELLLVVSEDGQLALVDAIADKFTKLAIPCAQGEDVESRCVGWRRVVGP